MDKDRAVSTAPQVAPVTPARLRLSARARDLHGSPVREILALVDRPGVISFAGGLPAAEFLPTLEAGAAPTACLQYGATEGEPALRARIAGELRALGLRCTADQILVLSGSQQGIDLTAKLFVDAGTPVAMEAPGYLAALQVFRFFGARLVGLDREDGFAALGAGAPVPLAYVTPTFQNPTGACYSRAERAALARQCDAHGTVLFEDDPYRDLAYDRCERRPICADVQSAPWIYQGSFSKTFAPGLRLGFLAASPELYVPLARLKQAADLHANRLSQWLVLQALESPQRAERLDAMVNGYRARRDGFAQALDAHFGNVAQWIVPAGGLFFWLRMRSALDTRALLPKAIARGVAYLPGEEFFPEPDKGHGFLRLNFSNAPPALADEGLRRLADLLRATAG